MRKKEKWKKNQVHNTKITCMLFKIYFNSVKTDIGDYLYFLAQYEPTAQLFERANKTSKNRFSS